MKFHIYTRRVRLDERGFTLVEMAIVLVIIGLILGAVVKGNDVILSAKQKKFYTSFLKPWELAVTSYYDRTGKLLGDGRANGGLADFANGRFDTINGGEDSDSDGINNALKKVGISLVQSNGSNNMVYSYAGRYSGNQNIWMNLYCLGDAGSAVCKNRLYLSSIPTDLAIAIDTMIDGQKDGTAGKWRRFEVNSGVGAEDWPDASTTPVVLAVYRIDLQKFPNQLRLIREFFYSGSALQHFS